MFGVDAVSQQQVNQNRKKLAALGVIAIDMETSALLTAATALGVSCASLCLGTVDAITQQKLDADAMMSGEQKLFEIALDGIAATP